MDNIQDCASHTLYQLSRANTSCEIRGGDLLVTLVVWSKTSGESHQKYACTYAFVQINQIDTLEQKTSSGEGGASFRLPILEERFLLGTHTLNDTWCNLKKNTQPCQDCHWAFSSNINWVLCYPEYWIDTISKATRNLKIKNVSTTTTKKKSSMQLWKVTKIDEAREIYTLQICTNTVKHRSWE